MGTLAVTSTSSASGSTPDQDAKPPAQARPSRALADGFERRRAAGVNLTGETPPALPLLEPPRPAGPTSSTRRPRVDNVVSLLRIPGFVLLAPSERRRLLGKLQKMERAHSPLDRDAAHLLLDSLGRSLGSGPGAPRLTPEQIVQRFSPVGQAQILQRLSRGDKSDLPFPYWDQLNLAPRFDSRLDLGKANPGEPQTSLLHLGDSDSLRAPIPITRPPEGTPVEGFLPSDVELATALAKVPPGMIKFLKRIEIHNAPHPGDPAAMDVRSDGTLRIWATREPISPQYLDHAVTHETAHLLAYAVLGLDLDKSTGTISWASWRAAARADGRYASAYGQRGVLEDAAEAIALYVLSKGSPHEVEARKLLSHRFKLVDQMDLGITAGTPPGR